MLPVDLSLLEAPTPTPAPTPPPPSSLVFAAGDIPSLLFIPPDAQHPQGTLLAAAATPNWEHSITMRRSHDGGSTWSEAVSPMQHAAGQPKCAAGAMACITKGRNTGRIGTAVGCAACPRRAKRRDPRAK